MIRLLASKYLEVIFSEAVYFLFFERNTKHVGIFHFLLVDYRLPQLLDFLPHLHVLYLVAHNSAKILNNCEHIELEWYLPELYIL